MVGESGRNYAAFPAAAHRIIRELDQAEAIYRKVLSVDANNFYALRFLGCLCRLKVLMLKD